MSWDDPRDGIADLECIDPDQPSWALEEVIETWWIVQVLKGVGHSVTFEQANQGWTLVSRREQAGWLSVVGRPPEEVWRLIEPYLRLSAGTG